MAALVNSKEQSIDRRDESPAPTLSGINEQSEDAPQTADPESLKHEPPTFSPPKSLLHEIVFLIVICAAQLLTQSGLSLSIVPLDLIADSFDSTPKDLTWASSAYSLTVGTFIFVSGRLGDVYGHKILFVIGFSWFALWSMLAGFSIWVNPIYLDICRALQGIGPAFLLPNAVAILGRTYPPGLRKQVAFCLFGSVAPGGFIVGGLFGSLLAQFLWWPWAYWIMAIACALFALLGSVVIPSIPQIKPREDLSMMARLDVWGAIPGMVGLILINFAWNQAAAVGWQEPYNYTLLIVGLLSIVLFLWVEFHAAYPLLPRSVFRGETGWVIACIVCGWASFGVVVFYYFSVMMNLEHESGLLVTAKFAWAAASGGGAAILTAFLIGRIPASYIMLIAMVMFTVGQILLATRPLGQIYWANGFLIPLLMPIGMDMSFPSAILIMSNAMPQEDQGAAGSLINTAVNYSIAMGLGFAGVVETYVADGDTLRGYHGAEYMGVGLAGLGVICALCFIIVSWRASKVQA
ncbi:major facilitator superfamily transporter [Penicillium chermesinum]|uniref:Major facilitator superfamily transporter n=1 Tax=Penicillium chermesinum TaxID=63820 RepID=A0A9W9NC47_9EURO|nr:major facilitator superfamily transporter [Penicillium chermesinum]KAJ5217137.1 major facilitator superfamily transporter [Penicillium chermesinum]